MLGRWGTHMHGINSRDGWHNLHSRLCVALYGMKCSLGKGKALLLERGNTVWLSLFSPSMLFMFRRNPPWEIFLSFFLLHVSSKPENKFPSEITPFPSRLVSRAERCPKHQENNTNILKVIPARNSRLLRRSQDTTKREI